MFNSTVLEVSIGLVFAFASISLIVSSLKEALATVCGLRAKTLLAGVQALLNDPHFTGLARDLYNHALVNPRGRGDAQSQQELTSIPSYIDSHHFASAFVEKLQASGETDDAVKKSIELIENPQIRQLLQGMHQRADGKIEALRTQISTWFDAGMDRVSGEYKRTSKYICLGLGLLVAAILNVDAFHLFGTLWMHPTYIAQLDSSVQTVASSTTTLSELQKLPIGWTQFPSASECLIHFPGWLITATSALFGAPFWFDLLQKLTPLRGNTGKPLPTLVTSDTPT